MSAREAHSTPWPYWSLATVLIAFGAVAIFSIGLPFLALGLVLIAVAPFRHEPRRFWPPVVAVIAFFAAWWTLSPVWCSARAFAPNAMECESGIGIEYDGNPMWIGPVAGLAAGLLFAAGTYAALRRSGVRSRRAASRDS